MPNFAASALQDAVQPLGVLLRQALQAEVAHSEAHQAKSDQFIARRENRGR